MLGSFQSAPTAWWVWACTSILVSGASTLILYDAAWSYPVGHGLATLYPALLAAGALRGAFRSGCR